MKRWQSLALGVVFSLATLAYALHGVDLASLRDEFAGARYIFLIPAIGCVLCGLFLRAVRWRALLNGRIALTHSFNILNIGYFFGAILPFRLGEVARVYLATRLQPPISLLTSLSTVIVERLTDTLAVVVMVALAVSLSPVAPQVVTAAQISGVLAVAGLIVLAILAARRAWTHRTLSLIAGRIPLLGRLKVAEWLEHLLDGIAPLGSVRGVGAALGLTALAWTMSTCEGFVLMAMFYDQPNWNATLLMIAMGALAVALPAVPGNVGPFEAAVIYGMVLGGMVTPDSPELRARALAFAVTVHIVNTGMYAFTGWIGLGREGITVGELVRSAQALTRRSATTAEAPVDAVIAAPRDSSSLVG